MEAINKTLVSFHIGRGGKYYNGGHLSFIGFKSIREIIMYEDSNLFISYENYYEISKLVENKPNLRELLEKCYDLDNFEEFERRTKLKVGQPIYADCNGNELIKFSEVETGCGRLNFDNEYNTDYVKHLEDCDEHECELILADYFTSNEVQEYIYEKFDSLKPIENETNN
jgi:hypothetical protein